MWFSSNLLLSPPVSFGTPPGLRCTFPYDRYDRWKRFSASERAIFGDHMESSLDTFITHKQNKTKKKTKSYIFRF